ncbi:hypothetical protein EV138_4400 [Kribbella voronezhensis]|uniref:Uncharacterized protein n=1 Tax=Kribbella voronezhensis TaxID=2512212 RepID=A0A4V3FKM9_9ACTN|nr:hypothetical protein [Kribbella voronezhensis]TDU90803.1 hypothetical protein EV138_4400 [Kribbella voronezhensis]
MRKRFLSFGVPVVAVLAVLGGAWIFDARSGAALDESGGSLGIRMDDVRQGADVYFLAPTPINRSGRALELLAAAPDQTPAGLEFVEARVYKTAEFLDGVPACWATGRGEGADPARHKSTPIAGQRIGAHADLGAVIYLHFRVSSAQRPLISSGVRFSYRRGFREHSQVLGGEYSVGELT